MRRLLALALLWGAASAQVHTSGALVATQVIPGDVSRATTAALNLYVDTTGNDANDCTASGASACLTIQGAVNKVPKRLLHAVDIAVGAGTFAGGGAYVEGFSCEPGASASTGGYLRIHGTLATATVATGTATGTATSGTASSGNTGTILTDSGQSWTVDDLRGKLLEITAGTGSGQVVAIASNTATAITLAASLGTTPNNTSVYAIRSWGTVISGALALPAGLATYSGLTTSSVASQANEASFIVSGIRPGATAPTSAASVLAANPACVMIERFAFTHASASAVDVRESTGVWVARNSIGATSAAGGIVLVSSGGIMESNSAVAQSANVTLVAGSHHSAPRAGHIVSGNVTTGGCLYGRGGSGQQNVTAAYAFLNYNHSKNANCGIGAIAVVGAWQLDLISNTITANSGGPCLALSGSNPTVFGGPGVALLSGNSFSSCTGDAVRAVGPWFLASTGVAPAGTGSTGFGFSLMNGAVMRTNPMPTTTGTAGDLSFDGTNAASTWANLTTVGSLRDLASGSTVATTNVLGLAGAIPTILPRYTTATLPDATKILNGGVAYDTTDGVMRWSDGSSWIRAPKAASITLSGGTGTATVPTGCTPLCMDATDPSKLTGCSVTTTTLTATASGASDVVKWICL